MKFKAITKDGVEVILENWIPSRLSPAEVIDWISRFKYDTIKNTKFQDIAVHITRADKESNMTADGAEVKWNDADLLNHHDSANNPRPTLEDYFRGNKNQKQSDAHSRQVGGTHYKTLAVEPWKAMKAWLTPEEWIGFLRGNIIKYHARANSGKGTREENLAKAAHYQQALDETMKENQVNKT